MLNAQTITEKSSHRTEKKTAKLFEGHPHEHVYWKALLLAAKNKKQEALELVQQAGTVQHAALILQSDSIEDFFDHLHVTYFARDPEILSFLGIFESLGVTEHAHHLNEVGAPISHAKLQERKECLQILQQHSPENLTPEQRVSHAIFLWMLRHEIAGEPFLFHEYTINQMFGVIIRINMVFGQFHALVNEQDVKAYHSRLSKIPAVLQQTQELLEYQKEHGISLPHCALEKVINSIRAMISLPVHEHPFYVRLVQSLNTMQHRNAQMVLVQIHDLMQQEIYPAYQTFLTFCGTLQENALPNHGVWALPQGEEYYAHMLKQHTTTNLSADEIHTLGLQEVAQIQQQMRAIFAQEGIVDATKEVGELIQELAHDERFFYPDTDEGRKQCLADFTAIVERSRQKLYHLFDIKPSMKLEIRALPKHEEEGAPAAYYLLPSIDGSRPGIFFVNLRNMKEIHTYGMETLAIHEAEPGHHFQCALQQEMDMPLLRKLGEYNAYLEGWALYVEKLAYEHDFYSSSWSKLGHLQDELWRAARLVVDTGIHHKRWTREQAIEYMVKTTGFHRDSVATEIERYIVMPGQACSYKIGQLKILELRERAKKMLGDKFDIRVFHNVVLTLGAAPLEVLEQVVEEYIQRALARC